METFTMSKKELPRAGLVKAALSGRITNRQGATALHLTIRQFQRLKRRFETGGAPPPRPPGPGPPPPRPPPANPPPPLAQPPPPPPPSLNAAHPPHKPPPRPP